MVFGFDETTKDSGKNLMLPGINRKPASFPELADVDTFITGINYLPKEGATSASLEVCMRDSEGRTLESRFFDPTEGEYGGEKAVKKFVKVAANLARKFLGESFVIAEQPTFEAFCNKLISDIGTRYQNVPLRTVVVLNSKDYPKLRSYAPIWELASIPEEKSTLVINPRFDNVAFEDTDQERAAENMDIFSAGSALMGGDNTQQSI